MSEKINKNNIIKNEKDCVKYDDKYIFFKLRRIMLCFVHEYV